VYARHGWLWRRLEIVPFTKIQTVRIEESPFDRRWDMATLHVDTAAAGGSLSIPYLSAEEAARLQRELVEQAGRRNFTW
jgi:putative membrane protein